MINYELDRKAAVVTGGASGIGLACAPALARSGAVVCLRDLKAEPLEAAVAELEQYGRHPRDRQALDQAPASRIATSCSHTGDLRRMSGSMAIERSRYSCRGV